MSDLDDLIAWAKGDGGVLDIPHPGDEAMAIANLTNAAEAELAALRAALEEAREALRPFAPLTQVWGIVLKDDSYPIIADGVYICNLGHLRRAAAALARLDVPQPPAGEKE